MIANKIKTVLLLPVLSLVAFAGWRSYQGQDVQARHAATTRQRLVSAQAVMDKKVEATENGMELRSAGFHLVLPEVPFDGSSNSILGHDSSWSFSLAIAAYIKDYLALQLPDHPEHANVDFGDTEISMWFSVDRILPPEGVSLDKVFSNGAWSIIANFDERTLRILDQVHGPVTNSASFTDWYGLSKQAGEAATEMTAALVANGVGMLPFSLTDMVGLPGPQQFVVAHELSEQEAGQIISYYND